MSDRPFGDHDRSRETGREHNLSQVCKCLGSPRKTRLTVESI